MNEKTNWLILNKYPFELLPGEETVLPEGVKSYYHYLNEEPHETGKNVQGVAWLVRNLPQGLRVVDPYGGVGVFAVAINEILKPEQFLIGELDDGCVAQLRHTFAGRENVKVFKADAREMFAAPNYPKGDLYVCDFPRFTLRRLQKEDRWGPELRAMCAANPRAVIMSDGSAHLNHFVRRAFKKIGEPVGDTYEDFVYYASSYFYQHLGYSIAACAYHGNCFYYRLEATEPSQIEFLRLKSGSYRDGLKRV